MRVNHNTRMLGVWDRWYANYRADKENTVIRTHYTALLLGGRLDGETMAVSNTWTPVVAEKYSEHPWFADDGPIIPERVTYSPRKLVLLGEVVLVWVLDELSNDEMMERARVHLLSTTGHGLLKQARERR